MSVVATILRYDLKRFLRDRLMLAFSFVILLLYVAVATFVPDDITPKWDIAVTGAHADRLQTLLDARPGARAAIARYDDEQTMRAAFEAGADHVLGIAIDVDAAERLGRGERPSARIFVDESAPPASQAAARGVGAMMAAALFAPDLGKPKEVERLGPVLEQPGFRERSVALMAVFLLMIEMLALASLISREATSGVVHGVLTTTVSLPSYFAAKVTFGVVLAFTQAFLVAALTGGLAPNPGVIALHLLLGAVIFTAAGITAGTRGKHLMEVLMWGMLFMIPCVVPAIAAMLPGTAPVVVQVLPTFPLVQGVLTSGQSDPLVAPWVYLAASAAWGALLCALAYAALRQRVK